MKDEISIFGSRNLREIQTINRDLTEKALRMRCTSYLSGVKARLLTETIYEMGSSKKKVVQEHDALQKQMIQLQKVESFGLLAGGMAHDFNNILSVIVQAAQLSLLRAEPGSETADEMEMILQASERGMAYTGKLLAMSRHQELELKVININPVISNLEKLLKSVTGSGITVSTTLSDDVKNVKADMYQVEQVLLNLVVNARDAMNGKGELIIETAQVYLDDNFCHRSGLAQSGYYVQISVTDNGPGIPKQTLEHIFDPFYSTKEAGKGTGLGLSTVQGIVQQHKGCISVYSEVDSGTSFHVYLPVIRELQLDNDFNELLQLQNGTETVLVVDDQQAIVDLVGDILHNLGYRVIKASSIKEAAALLKDRDIQVMLTDVIVPGENSLEFIQSTHKRYPGIRVIAMSGYNRQAVVGMGLDDDSLQYIQKPLTPLHLSSAIRKALAK
jgi:two-component system cell cycle sensor histidine kinase/response regulator CckA